MWRTRPRDRRNPGTRAKDSKLPRPSIKAASNHAGSGIAQRRQGRRGQFQRQIMKGAEKKVLCSDVLVQLATQLRDYV